MFGVHFATPLALLLAAAIPAVWLLLRVRTEKALFSRVRFLNGLNQHRFLRRVPTILFSTALALLVVAMLGPYTLSLGESKKQGRAIILCLDISGSMKWRIDKDKVKAEKGESRFDLLSRCMAIMAREREELGEDDYIMIIVFDDTARVALSWTNDYKQVYRKSDFLSMSAGLDEDFTGGTNFGGKGPGPLDLAATEFDKIKAPPGARVVVMMTDGDDKLDKDGETTNHDRLFTLIRSNHMHLNVVGVGPVLAKGQGDIITLAKDVNGGVFTANTPEKLAKAFANLSAVTRGPLPSNQEEINRQQLFHMLALAAGLFACMWLWSEALIFNR